MKDLLLPMSTVTFAHDHLVSDLTVRILDRLASQEPQLVDQAVDALSLRSQERLSVHAGLLLEAQTGEPSAINRKALETVAKQLEREVNENPSVTAISNKDLVLITLDKAAVEQAGKAVETKLEKQLKAIEFTGAIGALVLEDFNTWSVACRAKIAAVLDKHQHPRLFSSIGIDSNAPALPEAFMSRFLHVQVGNELKPCRTRSLRR